VAAAPHPRPFVLATTAAFIDPLRQAGASAAAFSRHRDGGAGGDVRRVHVDAPPALASEPLPALARAGPRLFLMLRPAGACRLPAARPPAGLPTRSTAYGGQQLAAPPPPAPKG